MSTPDLARLFTTDGWLQDANEDGYPDGLRVRIVLPENAGPTVAAAAAELGARLGHETMALDLPLVVLDRDLEAPPTGVVLIGSSNRWLAHAAAALDLAPNEGTVTALAGGNVGVVGGSEEGTIAGLNLLTRHLPDLPGGGTLVRVTARVEDLCRDQGIAATAATKRAVVRCDAFEVKELEVEVGLADGDVDRAATWLQDAGTLGCPGVKSITFRIGGAGRTATVRRSEAEQDPVGPAELDPVLPAPGLDLARLYTIDGLLADTDGDFLPDAARARLEWLPGCGPAELAAAGNMGARLGLESTGIRLPLAGPHAIRIGPAGAGEPQTVRIERSASEEADAVEVRGAVAARWLSHGAPGPAEDDHPIRRTVERIAACLAGEDGPLPSEEIVWEEVWELPWEVDQVRQLCREEVLPRLRSGARVTMDVRVSEPVAVRTELARELMRQLEQRGATPKVTVCNAYKQGLSWLTEEVAPVLATLPKRHEVVIRCRDFRRVPGQEWFSEQMLKELNLVDRDAAERLLAKVQASGPGDLWRDPPIRWLLELYPVDELLGVPRERVRFEIRADQETTYEVVVFDAQGTQLWEDAFTAAWDERPYLDAYPDLGMSHPPTGWFRAEVDGELLVDRRVATDVEQIWDRYQRDILPRLASYVRERAGGPPRPGQQPFFSAFEIHAILSEADDVLPVREERVSALEALHEDLYFVTLEFLKELGRREGGASLDAPGQVIPWIRDGAGTPPRVHWVLKRFAEGTTSRAALLSGGSLEGGIRVVGVDVGAEGEVRLAEVRVELPVAASVEMARERLVTLSGLPVEAGILLQAGGAAPVQLRVPQQPSADVPDVLAARVPRELPRGVVIGYEEHLDVLAGLAQLRGVRVRAAGRSFQGRVAWVIEAALPGAGSVVSHAKQAAWKPTLLINARHHGNEASSTVSGLQLVRWLAGDPAWQRYLRRMNLVVVPFENLDGGAIAWEMQREHPRWMLHAGRFSALGLEMRNAYGDPGSPSRESRVLPGVWRRWLPDVVVDDHGFPSHEWVQPFSGYAPLWPSYWIPRGLAYAYLRRVDDPAYPDHTAVTERLRDLMAEEVGKDGEILAWNRDWADRYETYGHRWMPEMFPTEHYRGLVVYHSPASVDVAGNWESWGTDFGTLYPWVTAVSFVTEIADETAQGRYMDLCARAHEAIDVACVRLLAEADHRFWRRRAADRSGVTFWAGRQRPVRPLPLPL